MFWIVCVLCLALPSFSSACSLGMWKADPADCGKFRMCVLGRETEFKCPDKTVTNQMMQACVPQGSYMDTCSKTQKTVTGTTSLTSKPDPTKTDKPTTQKTEKPTTPTIPTTSTQAQKVNPFMEMCKASPTAVLPHPQSCAKQVDCSLVMAGMVGVMECPFPTLWSTDTKRCDNPFTVKCGTRWEPKDACEYESNACKHSSHCVPCEIRFPSCKGRADGINAWSGRERTPYFVVCENERLVRQGQCTYDEESHIVFDPIERACVRL